MKNFFEETSDKSHMKPDTQFTQVNLDPTLCSARSKTQTHVVISQTSRQHGD